MLKQYMVYYMGGDQRWVAVGLFRARSASGAIQQFAKDLRHFPDCVAIRALLA